MSQSSFSCGPLSAASAVAEGWGTGCRCFVVDAFTAVPFGGNTAGVVLLERDASFPDEQRMQQVAAEFRYSETAFVVPCCDGSFRTRYFTPTGEVPLCGHATVATFGVLRRLGMTRAVEVVNHTAAGDLRVTFAGPRVMMQMARPQLLPPLSEEEQAELWRVMGVPQPAAEAHPAVVTTGLPDILLPLPDVEALQALAPDFAALAGLNRRTQTVGVHAYAMADDGYTAHVRNFAPLYGIDEESATGTSNAALAYLLYRRGKARAGESLVFLQGEAMGRPSEVAVEVRSAAAEVEVWVGGEVSLFCEGRLLAL